MIVECMFVFQVISLDISHDAQKQIISELAVLDRVSSTCVSTSADHVVQNNACNMTCKQLS